MNVITADDWNRPYSRVKAAFPAVSLFKNLLQFVLILDKKGFYVRVA